MSYQIQLVLAPIFTVLVVSALSVLSDVISEKFHQRKLKVSTTIYNRRYATKRRNR